MTTEIESLNYSLDQEIMLPSKHIDNEHGEHAICHNISFNQENDSQRLSWHSSKANSENQVLNKLETEEQPYECKDSLDNSQGSINTLNDDCLLHIFCFLSVKQLIGIERVCKRWRELSYRSWRKIKSLNVGKSFSLNKDFVLGLDKLRQVLLRCGNHLKSLEFSQRQDRLNSFGATEIIGELCPNLEHLSTGRMNLRSGISSEFLACIENLKTLDLTNCYNLTDRQLTPLLVWARRLEKLFISEASDFKGTSLMNLDKKIKHLVFMDCEVLRERRVAKALWRLTDLEYLKIESRGFSLDLRCLQWCCESIKELHFNEVMLYTENCGVPVFPNLRVLEIRADPYMDDEFLTILVRVCPNVEELDFSGDLPHRDHYNVITDAGIRALVSLRKLKCLRMSRHKRITSSSLEYLADNLKCPQLHTIECRGCKSITNGGASRLIGRFPNLTTLDVAYCKKITSDLIDSALNFVKQRTNHLPLNLHLTGSRDEEYKDGDRILLKVWEEEPLFFEF